MIMPSVWTLRAMAGRHLSSPDLLAWEHGSQQRCTDLVRAFQRKDLDAEGLRAALAGERLGTPPAPPRSSVAVLGLFGVLTPTPSIFSMLGFGTSMRDFTRQLTAATVDRAVKAIVVVVDSPGGSVRLVPEAAVAMRTARGRKPVIVSTVMAASAAYWVGSNATAMEATPSASVGAIGIITERVSMVKHLAQEGIDVTVVSAGKFKSEGHAATPITEAEQQALQQRVNTAYGMFINDVASGRHVPASAVRGGYGEGRLVEAPDALRLGMIDRVATVEDTIGRLLASPTAFTTVMTARVEQACTRFERDRRESARAEIAGHRARLSAAMQGRAMR